MQPGLIIVSNRLPVSVRKVEGKLEFSEPVGGLSMGLASYANNRRNKWIGWPGIASDGLSEEEQQQIAAELRKRNCYPVFLTQKQLDGFYNGYSNRLIWPLFHDLTVSKSAWREEAAYWKAYREVNREFADVVLALSLPGSDIWVHDYQLMLLPSLLRAERPEAQIGFFLHIPFPEPKDFSQLKQGANLISGILGADLAGFHIQSYADNFLAAAKHYDIGVVQPSKVLLANRVVRVTDFPIGIDYAKWRKARRLWGVRQNYLKLKLKYLGKRVIITVDRLDPSKGFIERLTAYRTLLEENPALRGKVKLVMIAVPSRTEISEYRRLKEKVETLVAEINRRFSTPSWQPIEYNYKSLGFVELRALYERADVAFVTPLRDGMNLVAKEFVASKPLGRGVLVLSKTAGAAQELKDAIMVDPRRPESLVAGLKRAVLMPKKRFKGRLKRMQQVIAEATLQTWAKGFVQSLKQTATTPVAPYTATLTPTRQKQLFADYRQAKKRLLLIDYDGVLVPLRIHPEEAEPNAELISLLKTLGSDPANELVIISGRGKDSLESWLAKVPAALVGEHGGFTRLKGSHRWQNTPNSALSGWQAAVEPLLEKYANLTPGAFVESKETSLVWHYRRASPYYAQKNLVVLKRLLRPLGKRYGLEIEQGNKILEIRPFGVNKGTSAVAWYEKLQPDFVLAMGDDYTDEDMFTALPASSYTVKIGRGRSAARFRLKNSAEAIRFLQKLAKR